jgi:carboxymethylenebutenolidase
VCVPADASTPELPLDHPLVDGERLTLTSADGTEFAAYEAAAAEPTGAGIVVLPDVRGLFAFYERLAAQLAACGVDAVGIDYFGRTAGLGQRSSDWDFWPHVQATRPEQVRQDVAAAVDRLRETRGVGRVYTVGFCFGGGQSFAQAYGGHRLAGAVGFYGFPKSRGEAFPAPIEHVEEMDCPVLGLFGGADEGIPVEVVDEFDRALTGAGVEHEVHVYDGAPHSFFDRRQDAFANESLDAWSRLLGFVRGDAG